MTSLLINCLLKDPSCKYDLFWLGLGVWHMHLDRIQLSSKNHMYNNLIWSVNWIFKQKAGQSLLPRSSRLARHHNKTLKYITTIFQIGTVQVIQTISMTNTYNYAVRRQKAPCLTRRNLKYYLLSWKILVLGVGCKGKATWLRFGKLIAIIV